VHLQDTTCSRGPARGTMGTWYCSQAIHFSLGSSPRLPTAPSHSGSFQLEVDFTSAILVSSAYLAFFNSQCGIPGVSTLYKTKAPPRCKLFIWLALLDGCWTSEHLQRHQLQFRTMVRVLCALNQRNPCSTLSLTVFTVVRNFATFWHSRPDPVTGWPSTRLVANQKGKGSIKSNVRVSTVWSC
jgi:hypothetical protein